MTFDIQIADNWRHRSIRTIWRRSGHRGWSELVASGRPIAAAAAVTSCRVDHIAVRRRRRRAADPNQREWLGFRGVGVGARSPSNHAAWRCGEANRLLGRAPSRVLFRSSSTELWRHLRVPRRRMFPQAAAARSQRHFPQRSMPPALIVYGNANRAFSSIICMIYAYLSSVIYSWICTNNFILTYKIDLSCLQ